MKLQWTGLVVSMDLPAGPSQSAPPDDMKSSGARDREAPVLVICDADMNFDDAAALAYSCQEHKQRHIDSRAVTFTEVGFGLWFRS